MRVVVCGSRDWEDPGVVRVKITEKLASLSKDTEIVTGGARGVDSWTDAIARSLGLPTTVMPADWDKFGRAAGRIRNIAMLDTNPDLVMAFWDGSSRGTKHTIDEAMKRNISVEVTHL